MKKRICENRGEADRTQSAFREGISFYVLDNTPIIAAAGLYFL